MLEISRKKLRSANIIYYAGVILTLAYVVVSLVLDWPRFVAFVFLVLALYGGYLRTSLFKCPYCGKSLFANVSGRDQRRLKAPEVCPSCEKPVEIRYVD